MISVKTSMYSRKKIDANSIQYDRDVIKMVLETGIQQLSKRVLFFGKHLKYDHNEAGKFDIAAVQNGYMVVEIVSSQEITYCITYCM